MFAPRQQRYSTALVHSGIVRAVCHVALELLGPNAKRALGCAASDSTGVGDLVSPSLNGFKFNSARATRKNGTSRALSSPTGNLAASATQRRRRRLSSMVGMDIPFAFARVTLDAMPASPTRVRAARTAVRGTSTSSRSAAGTAGPGAAPRARTASPTGDAAGESILTPRACALCAAHCSPSYDSLLPLIPLVQRFADDRLGTQYLQDFFATLIAGESASPYLQVTASDIRRRAASNCAASALSVLAVGVAGVATPALERSRAARYGEGGRGARASSGDGRSGAVGLGELPRASARLRRALPDQLEAMTLEGTRTVATMAAALHVMDRDLAPQIVDSLGAALSDSLEEAPKSGQRLLNLVKRHYDGGGAQPGRLPSGTLAESSAEAQSDEMRHLVGVLLRADATHERVALGMDLSAPDEPGTGSGGGGATMPRTTAGNDIESAAETKSGGASPGGGARAAVTDAQRRARSVDGQRALATAHERFEAVAGSPPMRGGERAASWLLPHADVLLVARLHRSMRAVARWCVDLEAEFETLYDPKSPSGGGAATTAATLQSIAAEEQAGAGLSSWMVLRAGTFHFARSRALDFISGADAAALFSEESDELVPLWLEAATFCGVQEARSDDFERGSRLGGATRREPAELKRESLTALANDELLALAKVARLPKRALRGSDAARKSIARTRRALLAVARECRNVALQCIVELRAQICFRSVFNVQHIFVAITVEQQELLRASSSRVAQNNAAARRRRNRLAPRGARQGDRGRDAHLAGSEIGAAAQALVAHSVASTVSELCEWLVWVCNDVVAVVGPMGEGGSGRAVSRSSGASAGGGEEKGKGTTSTSAPRDGSRQIGHRLRFGGLFSGIGLLLASLMTRLFDRLAFCPSTAPLVYDLAPTLQRVAGALAACALWVRCRPSVFLSLFSLSLSSSPRCSHSSLLPVFSLVHLSSCALFLPRRTGA